MTVETIADEAADWTSDDLMRVSFFLEKENPRTKFDVLACVCSFVAERSEKREQLSQKKKKKADEPMSSPQSVLCFLADPPKKKRSKRPRPPRIESELNPYHPPLKKLKKDDVGIEKVPVNGRSDSSPKGDAFMPQIVQTIEHKVPVSLKKLMCRDNMISSPADLMEQIEKMNGKEILLLGEKVLTDSDVKSNLSRLMMPESQMINSWKFLSDEENAFLKIKNGNKWNGIKVCVIEPCGESRNSVTLRRWEMKKEKDKEIKGSSSSSVSCVLTSGWNQLVRRNHLKSGNTVQLWSFRVGQDLHLALMLI